MPIKKFIDQLFDGKEEEALGKAKGLDLKEKPQEKGLEKPKIDKGKEITPLAEKKAPPKEVETLVKPTPVPKKVIKPKAQAKDEQVMEVERIMEEDLEEVYQRMDPKLKNKFKEKGEETATQISQILKKAKVKAKEILELIRGWLKMVPGINKFFLEQEAKIKTDKIMALKKKNNNKK